MAFGEQDRMFQPSRKGWRCKCFAGWLVPSECERTGLPRGSPALRAADGLSRPRMRAEGFSILHSVSAQRLQKTGLAALMTVKIPASCPDGGSPLFDVRLRVHPSP